MEICKLKQKLTEIEESAMEIGDFIFWDEIKQYWNAMCEECPQRTHCDRMTELDTAITHHYSS